MFFVNAALNDISIGTAGLVALLGYAVVFVGLIALMAVIMIVGKIMVAKKSAPAAAPAAAAAAAAPASAPKAVPAHPPGPAPMSSSTAFPFTAKETVGLPIAASHATAPSSPPVPPTSS